MPAPVTIVDFVTVLEREISNNIWPRAIRLRDSEGHFLATIEAALERFSKDKPRIGREDITGDGSTFEYILDTVISEWKHGLSSVRKVRLASTVATERLEEFLDPAVEDYEVKEIPGTADDDPTEEQLRILKRIPATTETLQIWYSTVHIINTTKTTIPEFDRTDFMNLAAALGFEKMAERAGTLLDDDTDETADYGDLVDRLVRNRDRRLKKYTETLLGVERPVKAAAAFVSIPTHGEHAPNSRWSHGLKRRSTR